MKFKSYAKINLNLFIVGRRADGYHLIQSVFYPLNDLYDEVGVEHLGSGSEFADKVSIERAPYIGSFEESLIAKTINEMRKFCGFDDKFEVTLHKNIPIGAGLGGGSSNAGTVINAIDSILDLNLPLQQKVEIAAKIGADVPFFITNMLSVVEGMGEIIHPVETQNQPQKSYHILLITPNFVVRTPEIYNEYKNWNLNGKMPFSKSLTHVELLDKRMVAANDLQPVVEFRYPEITDLLNALVACMGCMRAAISGSGGSCFGLFESAASLRDACSILRDQYPNYQIFECN